MSLRVIEPGVQMSVQDLGRPGYAHLGVARSGAADPMALVVGNRLIGNRDAAAGLEITLSRGVIAFESDADFAVTGTFAKAEMVGVDGRVTPVRVNEAGHAPRGATLTVWVAPDGMRAYVCVSGGIDSEMMLGSRSTYLPAPLALSARALRAGDVLPMRAATRPREHFGHDRGTLAALFSGNGSLRVTCVEESVAAELKGRVFTVQPRSNRSGIRLSPCVASLAARGDMITEATACGAIQITPDGTPIILFVDGPTTGGYPVIGHVIAADLSILGQLRLGADVRFECVERIEAQRLAILRSREFNRALPPCGVKVIDLNCDLGEGLPPEHDEALMRHASSVSIACGGHTGDAASMRRTIRSAFAHGCRIGAHPSYPDRARFGRETMAIEPTALERSLIEQIRALQHAAEAEGARVAYVKPHGALYNDAVRQPGVAEAIVRAVRACDPSLAIMGMAGSRALEAWKDAGVAVIAEGFADRRYDDPLTLRSRHHPDAMIVDPEAAAAHAIELASREIGGAESLCVHSDTPEALFLAATISQRMTLAGWEVGSFASGGN